MCNTVLWSYWMVIEESSQELSQRRKQCTWAVGRSGVGRGSSISCAYEPAISVAPDRAARVRQDVRAQETEPMVRIR